MGKEQARYKAYLGPQNGTSVTALAGRAEFACVPVGPQNGTSVTANSDVTMSDAVPVGPQNGTSVT